MAGLYLHVPFCSSKCSYCAFYSVTNNQLKQDYIEAVCKELYLRKHFFQDIHLKNNQFDPVVNTVYFGGGTPSCLDESDFEKIFNAIYDCFGTSFEEVTIECNPDDITLSYAKTLKKYANRISLGIQTFNNDQLKLINRRHNAEEAIKAVNIIKEVGISNISIDLIFGFPKETLADWLFDINQAIKLDVQHVSAYSLMFEEGTKLYHLLQKEEIEQISEELSVEMYDVLIDKLSEAGLAQYEISNFAKPGFESRHNSSYWNETPYLGVGPSAHSYNLSTRSWNVSNVSQYVKSISKGILPLEEEQIDEITRYNDLITTALRTKEGIQLNTLEEDYVQYLLEQSSDFIKEGTMIKTSDNRLALTRKGYYISDAIMAELIKV
ncbi:radical SAM family heme chaperone HemW [Hoylesella nanceiensis]|jgi:putative coproporphyrinogen dehydrogenase|uniref:radical SAM family heme chaperone HemW n=1 Tax=Hoylesella nanceiensis TaxID=425941 RepID=UPI001CB27AE9|nr:radical SAM family heme chaperone HemW [Hoylesella nanceiensis]MBF1420719.1 radical SAM family heme chaperone HemW [Hoylesella nanceiensis]